MNSKNFLCSNHKTSHTSSRYHILESIGDRSSLRQSYYTITEHLWMNTKVSVIQQPTKTSIRYWANTLKVARTREITIFPIKNPYIIQLSHTTNTTVCAGMLICKLEPPVIPPSFFFFQFKPHKTEGKKIFIDPSHCLVINLPWHLNPDFQICTFWIIARLYLIPRHRTNTQHQRGSQSLQRQTCIP